MTSTQIEELQCTSHSEPCDASSGHGHDAATNDDNGVFIADHDGSGLTDSSTIVQLAPHIPEPSTNNHNPDVTRDRLSIAPMMDVTDRYYRTFMRHLTKKTKLYTEMVVDQTLLHQLHNLEQFLGFNPIEHPIALQLGGDDPESLGKVRVGNCCSSSLVPAYVIHSFITITTCLLPVAIWSL